MTVNTPNNVRVQVLRRAHSIWAGSCGYIVGVAPGDQDSLIVRIGQTGVRVRRDQLRECTGGPDGHGRLEVEGKKGGGLPMHKVHGRPWR
jgi:hypothetical protein